MKTSIALQLVLCCSWLLGCQSEPADDTDTRGVIDQACMLYKDCAADEATCLEYAGKLRCEADCADGAACGPRGECVGGECWRSCSSASDCDSDWACRPLFTEQGKTSGSFCVAPCSLFACSYTTFTYTCGSGSFSTSTDITYAGSEPTANTLVSYGNGHVVQCSGTPSEGQCSDDSGAVCSW